MPEQSRAYQLIKELIGDGFIKDASQLSKLKAFEKDATVLERLEKVKRENKERLAAYVKKHNWVILKPRFHFRRAGKTAA